MPLERCDRAPGVPSVPILPRMTARMQTRPAPADTCSMVHHEFELFDANPEWRLLLAAYHEKIAAGSIEWSPRLADVAGLAAEELSAIHGKLIALGLLKFEIGSRAEGVHYQLTPLGRQALIPPAERQLIPDWMLEADPAA